MALRTTHVCRLILLAILLQSGAVAGTPEKNTLPVTVALRPAEARKAVPLIRPSANSTRPAVVLAPAKTVLRPAVHPLRTGKGGA